MEEKEKELEWKVIEEKEGVGTIGLDWLGIGWREGCGRGGGMPAGLVPLAWPSPPSSPHSPLS